MICKKCNTIIDDSSNYCMHCGQAVEKEVIWSIGITKDESLWNKEVFDEFPSIIAHEYHRIYELLLDDKTYGAMMQVKDLLEVILKLPIVIEMARIKEKDEKNEKDCLFITKLLSGALSLGHWREAINLMRKHDEHIFDSKFIKDLKELYYSENIFGDDKIDIVHWRNMTIGHGALAFDSDDNFKFEFKCLLSSITNHFNRWSQLYKNIRIYCGDHILFKGKDKATNLEYKNNNLFFENNEGVKLSLYPFLLLCDKDFYIYDALIHNSEKYDVLSYPIGRKQHFKKTKLQKDIKDIFEECNNIIKRNEYINQSNQASAEDDAFLIRYDDFLNVNDEEIYDMEMLDHWLIQGLNQSENKVFLLMMERGMGKTTWVKKISKGKGLKYDAMFKTIYLNDTYRSNWESIVSKIDQVMITDQNHVVVIDDRKNRHIRMDAEDIKKEIADFFNYYIDIYKSQLKTDKIVLVLDGIDEIKLDNSNNILDWIPTSDMLPEDFYILLTCRNSQDISKFLNICLDELRIPENNKLTIYREDERYRKVLEKYIKDNMNKSDIVTILNIAEYRFAYVNLLNKVMKYGNNENFKLALEEGQVMEAFLGMIENYYGKKDLHYLYDLIYIIANAPESITIKELSYLLGDDKISFKLLGFLNDLKGILKYERRDKKNKISISNEIYRDSLIRILLQKDVDLKKRVQAYITDLVSDIYIENVLKDKEILGEGQGFLLLHLNHYYNEDIAQYMDYEHFKKIFNCAERYIKTFTYEDTKRGYEMLENIDMLYANLSLNYNNDSWLEQILKQHIHLICQYKLLFRWKDLYIDDHIAQRLYDIKKKCEEQQNDIYGMNLDRLKDPFQTSIVMETFNLYTNILIEYGSYYFMKSEYSEAKKMLLLASLSLKEGIISNEAQNRKIVKLLYYIYDKLGDEEEALKYHKEYSDLIKEMESYDEQFSEEYYEAKVFRFNEDLMNLDPIESKKQKIYREVEEIENSLKMVKSDSHEYYRICEYESLILSTGVNIVGDEYLRAENFFELLEFLEKIKEIKNKIQNRNFTLLSGSWVYILYYSGVANMRIGSYDDAFTELNLLKRSLDEIDTDNSPIRLSEEKILYLKYILYIHLCRYSVFKNQDYKEAFNYFLKAADIYRGRIKVSDINDGHTEYLKQILGLYDAIYINAREGNEDLLKSLKELFEEYNELFSENIKRFNWEKEYIIIDKKKDKFIGCAYGANPKKFGLSGEYYEFDFKRVCNRCDYKDCIGYRSSGVFKLKKLPIN